MSISERDQQALDLIEEDLAGSVPELAAKLAVFTRLTADEAMPPRERVWHRARTPAARLASAGERRGVALAPPAHGMAACRQAPAHAPAPGRPGAGAGAISHE